MAPSVSFGGPEAPLGPFSTVPFSRDPDFIDNRGLCDRILEGCLRPASAIALVGLGGVGKSQLAVECCYRIQEESPDKCVLWAHASNVARLQQSFQDIASLNRIPDHQDPNANPVKLVSNWLRFRKWVLVLDNHDNDEFFYRGRSDGPPLIAFLPCGPNGSIILTTRDRHIATKFANTNDILQINPMDKLAALSLVKRKLSYLGRQGEKDEKLLVKLVKLLESMPLAIAQATA
ncbi:hypothetical protein N7520_002394 [Penicillium odoratum]|uniref:uncharacterized protein n=1 Tax=Penicillium odoratum TaxID=1167516 RepID=UPI00254995D3|nr:uncharacterized protein N7520_002394 [Penicillium odoratum]KAJ5771865.1 hypothetical protein N7520_002394 [Penicillium odoratum]